MDQSVHGKGQSLATNPNSLLEPREGDSREEEDAAYPEVSDHGSECYLACQINEDKTYRYAGGPLDFKSADHVRRKLAHALLHPMHEDLSKEGP